MPGASTEMIPHRAQPADLIASIVAVGLGLINALQHVQVIAGALLSVAGLIHMCILIYKQMRMKSHPPPDPLPGQAGGDHQPKSP